VDLVARAVRRVPWLAHQVDRGTDRPRTVETVSGAAMLIRRAAFESVGGFDEGFSLYGEDLDLCRRLRVHGWTLLYLPVTWAVHDNGASSANWSARELRWWEGTMRFAASWWGPWRFGAALVAAGLAACRVSTRAPRLTVAAWRAMVVAPLVQRRSARR
jgi:GT2 family glycosyltransferase